MVSSPGCRGIVDLTTMGTHRGAPIPEDDWQRVEALNHLKLLDTNNEQSFDRITEACSQVFQVPIALVSLVDKDRQWFKSARGLSVCETSRDVAFCAHAILAKEPGVFLVPDATKDPRFMFSPLVVGPPNIRFYAGAPLEYEDKEHNKYKLGTLCIIDTVPREFSKEQQHLLMTLARLVVAEITLRDTISKEHDAFLENARTGAENKAKDMNAQYIGQVAHDLRTPLNSFTLGLQALAGTELTEEQSDLVSTMEVSAQLMDLTCTKALDHTQVISPLV